MVQVKINQLKAGSMLSYLQLAVSMIISLIYTPAMLNILGKAEYGVYSMASSAISYLTILNLGFGSSYVRFYSQDKAQGKDTSSTNGLFLSVFLILGVVCFFAGLVLVKNVHIIFDEGLTTAELSRLRLMMMILTVSTTVTLSTSVFSSIITANEKFVFQKIINILKTIFSPIVCWIFLALGYRSVMMTLVSATITIVVDIINVYYCIVRLKTKFSLKNAKLSRLIEIGGFSFFIAVNSIVDQVNWNIDTIILGRFCGSAVTATYSVGAYINNLYMNISVAISSVFVPRINRMIAEKKPIKEVTDLFAKISRVQIMILAMVLFGFVFLGRQFLDLWAPSGYGTSYTVALLLMLGGTIPFMQNAGIAIQTAMAKHQIRSIACMIMAVINVAMSIPLAKFFGPVGSASGTFISLISVNTIFMNIYYHKGLHLDMIAFWKQMLNLLPAFISSCIVGGIIYKFIPINNYFDLILAGTLFVGFYVSFLFVFSLNDSEKRMLRSMLKRKR